MFNYSENKTFYYLGYHTRVITFHKKVNLIFYDRLCCSLGILLKISCFLLFCFYYMPHFVKGSYTFNMCSHRMRKTLNRRKCFFDIYCQNWQKVKRVKQWTKTRSLSWTKFEDCFFKKTRLFTQKISIVFWTNERFTINLFSYVKNMQLFWHRLMWRAELKSFIHNVEKWPNIFSKSCGVTT